jgi:hypothetical protein
MSKGQSWMVSAVRTVAIPAMPLRRLLNEPCRPCARAFVDFFRRLASQGWKRAACHGNIARPSSPLPNDGPIQGFPRDPLINLLRQNLRSEPRRLPRTTYGPALRIVTRCQAWSNLHPGVHLGTRDYGDESPVESRSRPRPTPLLPGSCPCSLDLRRKYGVVRSNRKPSRLLIVPSAGSRTRLRQSFALRRPGCRLA